MIFEGHQTKVLTERWFVPNISYRDFLKFKFQTNRQETGRILQNFPYSFNSLSTIKLNFKFEEF